MSLPRRAFLGAELPPDGEAFSADGMRIAGVLDGGMAAAAGLMAGDIVVAIAGEPVRDLSSLALALRRAAAGSTTAIEILRDGQRRTHATDVIAMPREPGVLYDELDGLRLLITQPASPRALIVFIAGIACESIDAPFADTPLDALVAGWTRGGFATLRFDKRGIGDSNGGPCRTMDFTTELADARLVVAHAVERARSLDVPLVVFGHSVGGIIAPLLARESACRAVIVYGTPVMPWLACLDDSIRRQLELRGASALAIAEELERLAGLTVAGEMNGRSAAYHAQLAAIDIEAAWRDIGPRPVAIIRGEYDWVVRADDQARIGELAPGPTTLVDIDGLDHLFGWHEDRAASLRDYGLGAPTAALAHATIEWLESVL